MKSALILLLLVTPWMAKIVIANKGDLGELFGVDSDVPALSESLYEWERRMGRTTVAVCRSTREQGWGWVPGKFIRGSCYYSAHGKEYETRDRSQMRFVTGKRLRRVGQSLKGCKSSGYERDNNQHAWSAIIRGQDGYIPGKYINKTKTAYYGFYGKEYLTKKKKNIWIICA